MQLTILPTRLTGSIRPPASKSQGHRLLMAAALAAGKSEISALSPSQDISATLRCMEALGAKVVPGEPLTLQGIGDRRGLAQGILDCGESGSTLRFLLPIALAVAGGGTFRGHGRLMQRPQTPYFEIFKAQGIHYALEGDTLTLSGTLKPGTFSLPGDVSSQFVTGLLYALPLLAGDSEIRLTSPLQSRGYVDMTLEALAQGGISVEVTDWGYRVPGRQHYRPITAAVEADYSQAAFFYAMAGMGCPITVTGMGEHSAQGDRAVVPMMQALSGPGTVTLDVRECPDLVPPLAARAALRPGATTHIVGAGRLRIKESDRLASVTQVLSALGADITEEPESLTIVGRETLPGGASVDSWNDHRIAMMAAAAACGCEAPVTITGAEAVGKSYPDFWRDYQALGGKVLED